MKRGFADRLADKQSNETFLIVESLLRMKRKLNVSASEMWSGLLNKKSHILIEVSPVKDLINLSQIVVKRIFWSHFCSSLNSSFSISSHESTPLILGGWVWSLPFFLKLTFSVDITNTGLGPGSSTEVLHLVQVLIKTYF